MKTLRLLLLMFGMTLPFATQAQLLTRGFGLSFGMMQVPEGSRIDESGTTPIIFMDSMLRPASFSPTLGINIPLQFRLANLGYDQTLGLYMNPTVGVYLGRRAKNAYGASTLGESFGFPLAVQVPFLFQYMKGNFSSFESESERGFAVGLGAEYGLYLDAWAGKTHSYWNYDAVNLSGIRPAASFHYRWWTKNSTLSELTLLLSYFGYTRDTGETGSSLAARLSYNFYFNY